MTSTETQALKIIWESKARVSSFKIAKELRISPDYCRVICQGLLKNKIVELSEGQYKITSLGKKELEKFGIIKRIIKKRKKLRKKTPITILSGISSESIKALHQHGLYTLEDIATTALPKLMGMIEGLELRQVAHLINEARGRLKKQGKEDLWRGNNYGQENQSNFINIQSS